MRDDIEQKLINWFESLIDKYSLSAIQWQFSLSQDKICLASLTKEEQEIFQTFKSPERKISWLKGKNALSKLTTKDERQFLQFPNKELSLSHSGDYAIAFKVCGLAGAGADLQQIRKHKIGIENKFLTNTEKVELNKFEILQLWSIKEAIFKANLNNKGTYLMDYCISSFDGEKGTAYFKEVQFEFLSILIDDYYFSFAVRII
jgi:phosphopantetheinyl transferase (holo-ACP synthase)